MSNDISLRNKLRYVLVPLFDRLMASRLMTELNGTGGLFRGVPTTADLYTQLFGTEFPARHQVRWSRESLNPLVLTFISPWYPPSGEVMGELSGLFDAEIRHSWNSPDVKLSDFNCFGTAIQR